MLVWCGATRGSVHVIGPSGGWRQVAGVAAGGIGKAAASFAPEQLGDWSRKAAAAGGPWCETPDAGARPRLIAPLSGPGGISGLVVIEGADGSQESIERLTAALALPEAFEQRRLREAVQRDASRLAGALDLLALINTHRKLASAAMAVCNELAARFGADRASLGWIEKNYIAVKAMSHTERIEPKMQAVQELSAVMEEACDQEEEILFPRPGGQSFVTRDHETYARHQEAPHLATLPIFGDGGGNPGTSPKPVGAVTLERSQPPFSIEELRTLRLMLDQLARPLADLQARDRWFGARWVHAMRRFFAGLLGAEHTWWKVLAVALAGGLLVLVFGRGEHRVEGSFTLKTDAMAHLAAPFEGHIESVAVRPGDSVKSGDVLLALDTRELLLQKEAALAERERHAADALKAESSGDVAAMRIAQARLAQAQAQIDIANDRLERSTVRAPFDGVIVEGDLRERIAAPVQKGDVLLKLARIEDLYPVIDVPERDVDHVREGAKGAAAFASQPARRFELVVERIQPVARMQEGGNLFSVQGRFSEAAPGWWRPGMRGIAKIDAGQRSLLWIYTHRTADFLRLWWW
jgi:RND family efflux transporter MFP subunit